MKTLAAALLLLLAAGSTIAADYTAPNGGLTARVMAAAPHGRIRHGDWRAVYEIQGETVTVIILKIGNRKEIYR